MYSAQIYKEDFLTVKRIMKEHSRSIEKALEKCNKILLGMKRECENYTVYDTFEMCIRDREWRDKSGENARLMEEASTEYHKSVSRLESRGV